MATYIGIDISKLTFDCYFGDNNYSTNFDNNNSGFKRFFQVISKHYSGVNEVIVVLEPTGGYERALINYLQEHHISYSLAHPSKVRNYAKAIGKFAKTDKLDAKLIFDFANNFSLTAKERHISPKAEELRSLINRRQDLLLLRNQESNKLETETNKDILSYINKHLSFLNKQLEAIQLQIDQLCNEEPEISSKIKQLTSIPGVGQVLATHILTELPEIEYLDIRKLTALVGLAPFARQSGNSTRKSSIAFGRAKIRRILYMAALASLRVNKPLKTFFDRLVQNHKPKKVALVAVMRKLLTFIHVIISNNTYWNYKLLS